MTTLYAFGLGIATANSQGNLLDTFYPYPIINVEGDRAALLQDISGRLDTSQLLSLAASL